MGKEIVSTLPRGKMPMLMYIEITELPEGDKAGKILFSDRGETLAGDFTIEDRHCIHVVWFGESDKYFSVVKSYLRNGELYLQMEMNDCTRSYFVYCDLEPTYDEIMFTERAKLVMATF